MNDTRLLSKLSRQELYDLIWSAPATKLAADIGISSVALAKRCKNQNVPTPSRGYWAKRAVGDNPPREPLPPPPEDVFAHSAKKRVGRALALPRAAEPLHPLATELIKALLRARLDSHKRNCLKEPTLPEVEASKSLAQRIGLAFHVILNGVEPLGILYRKSLSTYGAGFFRRRNDRLFLEISEALVDLDGTIRSVPDWQQPAYARPSGRLKFVLKLSDYSTQEPEEWLESKKTPLEVVLARVVMAIRTHFLAAQQRRIQEAIEAKKRQAEWDRQHLEWLVKEEVRLQQERDRNHAAALVF